jgi:hypothetical protein
MSSSPLNQPNRRQLFFWLVGPVLILLIAGGLYLILHIRAASPNRGGLVAVDLHSVLTPDYGVDLTPVEVPPVDEGIIISALNDQPTPTNQADLAATLAGGLQTPVPTVTLGPTLTATPTNTTRPTLTPTRTPAPPTATPAIPTRTRTPTPTLTRTPPPTAPVRTRTHTPEFSRTPTLPEDETRTVTPTPTPTGEEGGVYPPPDDDQNGKPDSTRTPHGDS